MHSGDKIQKSANMKHPAAHLTLSTTCTFTEIPTYKSVIVQATLRTDSHSYIAINVALYKKYSQVFSNIHRGIRESYHELINWKTVEMKAKWFLNENVISN